MKLKVQIEVKKGEFYGVNPTKSFHSAMVDWLRGLKKCRFRWGGNAPLQGSIHSETLSEKIRRVLKGRLQIDGDFFFSSLICSWFGFFRFRMVRGTDQGAEPEAVGSKGTSWAPRGDLKAQMMPYWASSCSSRWLKASHGQMTVISTEKGRDERPVWFLLVLETKILNSPVPKPSMPGMSSPKLQTQTRITN